MSEQDSGASNDLPRAGKFYESVFRTTFTKIDSKIPEHTSSILHIEPSHRDKAYAAFVNDLRLL